MRKGEGLESRESLEQELFTSHLNTFTFFYLSLNNV